MTVEAILQELRRHTRSCSVATVGGFRPPEHPIASWFGGNFLALPEDPWPTTKNGPMIPLLQAVAADAPTWPQQLREFAVVQVFIDRSKLPVETPVKSGDGWLLRTFEDATPLVRHQDPAPLLHSFPVQWRSEEGDSPAWEELEAVLTQDQISILARDMQRYFDAFHSATGTKLGGWPSYTQSAVLVPGEFVLQVATESKSGWSWGDSGNGYIYRTSDGWLLHWDCY